MAAVAVHRRPLSSGSLAALLAARYPRRTSSSGRGRPDPFKPDIVAWDIFFGLALLFAAPVFHAAGRVAVRNGLLIAGAMCVLGIIGPAVNHIALRQIGIIGYAVVWPIVCVPLSKAFRQGGRASGAIVPALDRDAEHASQSTDREPCTAPLDSQLTPAQARGPGPSPNGHGAV